MATNLQATCDAEVTTDESAHSELNKTGPKPLTEQHPLNSFAQSSASQRPEELASLLHAEVADPVKPSTSRDRHVPWFAWPLLVASLIAFSSAAVVFASIPDVPTCTLAAWRLQLTTFLLTPAAVYQFLHLPAGIPVEVDDNLCFGISAQCSDAQMTHIVCTCHLSGVSQQNNNPLAPLQMTGSVCAKTSCLCLPLVPFLGFISSSGSG